MNVSHAIRVQCKEYQRILRSKHRHIDFFANELAKAIEEFPFGSSSWRDEEKVAALTEAYLFEYSAVLDIGIKYFCGEDISQMNFHCNPNNVNKLIPVTIDMKLFGQLYFCGLGNRLLFSLEKLRDLRNIAGHESVIHIREDFDVDYDRDFGFMPLNGISIRIPMGRKKDDVDLVEYLQTMERVRFKLKRLQFSVSNYGRYKLGEKRVGIWYEPIPSRIKGQKGVN